MAKRVGAFVEILGAYRHRPSPRTIASQARVYSDGSDAERKRVAKQELERAVLFEVLVHHPTKSFKFGFGQGGSGMNSFAWDPYVLALDGRSLLGKSVPTGSSSIRVTFWIQDFNPKKLLKTEYGVVAPPSLSEMPKRLQDLVPFGTID